MKSLDYKFDFRDERNLSLVMDFYELTMSQCYFNSDHKDRVVTFDLFYRRNPDSGGYAVFAGLDISRISILRIVILHTCVR